MKFPTIALLLLFTLGSQAAPKPTAEPLLSLDNGTVRIGIDRSKGAAITWLSWAGYAKMR